MSQVIKHLIDNSIHVIPFAMNIFRDTWHVTLQAMPVKVPILLMMMQLQFS